VRWSSAETIISEWNYAVGGGGWRGWPLGGAKLFLRDGFNALLPNARRAEKMAGIRGSK
jgi:hypothetical protein